ncbi:MAG: dipeptide epimerase [Alphaproteobacteria bacterium]|nr:dipeptide epimerase [Alphaproteobacteria bacterium]
MNNYKVEIQRFPIAGDGFTISRETKRDADVVYVRLERNGFSGEGECVPLKRYHYTTQSVAAEITTWLEENHPWDRVHLMQNMKAGPARFALDTAMWQLEAAEQGKTFAQFFGGQYSIEKIQSLPTAFTLSGAAPEKMAAVAKAHGEFRWLKTKLMGDGLDAERLAAIHHAVPEMELMVDANEALTPETLQALLPIFQQNNVVLIEQPLPENNDEALRGLNFPIPFVADESCHDILDLEKLAGKYQVANIKLDKAGGLTHALLMKQRARELGLQVMIGCMASTSLSILPAFFLAQQADFIDLDGALLLEQDRREAKLNYTGGWIAYAEEA